MKFLFFLLLFISFTPCFSQQKQPEGHCKIKGKVIDSVTKKPVDYATVAVFQTGSTTVAGGMITDEKGQFNIDNLLPGTYYAKIDFVGYETFTQSNITVSDNNPTANLGTLKISPNARSLGAVTVTGSKDFMENKIDRFVYNAEKDLTSQGGVATDLLRKVPQVSVDVDGNIELLGSANVRVFINGKPSTMFDNNLSEALQSIPANQIKSIEVITSPGAQYDAQGTGGIINIILKDNTSQGVNGNITLTGGTRLENGSANIHAKKGKIDLNASLSGNAQLNSNTKNSLSRVTDSAGAPNEQLLQNGQSAFQRNGYRGQLGFEWVISKKDNLTASVSYNNFGNNTRSYIDQQQIYYIPGITDISTTNSNNIFRYRTTDWNVNYIKKFSKEGQELNIAYQSSYGHGSTFYEETQSNSGSINPFAGANGNNRLNDLESYVLADYAQPLSKNVVFNTGVKGSFSNITSYSDHYLLDTTSQAYIFDPSQLDNFTFNRDVYAAYVSLSIQLAGNYSIKAGLRDEYTYNDIPSDTGNMAPSYNSLIPSIVILRKLENNQTIKVSYYRRIQRANYRDLNPFIDATDPTSLIQGNPYLKPERTDGGEISYNRFFEKGSSILISLYYRNTQDDNQNYVLQYDSLAVGRTIYRNVTVTTTENAGTQQMGGIYTSGTLSVSQKLELRATVVLFDKYIVSNLVPGNTFNSFNYRINGNVTYQFSKTLIAEAFGSFNSPRTEIQGKFPYFTSYSFAIRKQLMNKKASIAFTTTDPFNYYTNQKTNLAGTDFTVNSNRRIPYQSFGINFTYKFGKMEFKEKKAEKESGPDEGN